MGLGKKRTDAENEEILRNVFENVGSDTEDNRALYESLSFKDGKILVEGEPLADLLWRMEDDANGAESFALRAVVLLVVELEEWLGGKSSSRRG